jgi:hypothetical protein
MQFETYWLPRMIGQARAPGFTLLSAIRAAARYTLEQQLELESTSQFACGRAQVNREGVTAFKERRPPRLTGR